jgi:hypothetical protein
MDYPKSVPSAGLENGKFVDENPVKGTPGSLIPAQWGNAVSEEILNVIKQSGLAPNEGDNTQLKTAILSIINSSSIAAQASQVEAVSGVNNAKWMSPLRVFQAITKVVGQATETVLGWAKIATQDQTNTGLDDSTIVTPKKLRAGFVFGNSVSSSIIAFPSWLGGYIIQTGSIGVGSGDLVTTLPMAFPNAAIQVIVCNDYTPGSSSVGYIAGAFNNLGSLITRGSSASLGARFIAIGR